MNAESFIKKLYLHTRSTRATRIHYTRQTARGPALKPGQAPARACRPKAVKLERLSGKTHLCAVAFSNSRDRIVSVQLQGTGLVAARKVLGSIISQTNR